MRRESCLGGRAKVGQQSTVPLDLIASTRHNGGLGQIEDDPVKRGALAKVRGDIAAVDTEQYLCDVASLTKSCNSRRGVRVTIKKHFFRLVARGVKMYSYSLGIAAERRDESFRVGEVSIPAYQDACRL